MIKNLLISHCRIYSEHTKKKFENLIYADCILYNGHIFFIINEITNDINNDVVKFYIKPFLYGIPKVMFGAR